MDNIISILSDAKAQYGFWGIVTIVLIVVLSQLIKAPLKAKAEELASETGCDKKEITVYFPLIPTALAFVLGFVLYLWRTLNWDLEGFDPSFYATFCSGLDGMSVLLFEAVDGALKLKLSRQQKALAIATGSAEVAAMKPAEFRAAWRKHKAQVKLAKKLAKAKAKAEKAEAAKAEEAKSVEEEIAAEEAKLAALKAKASGASAEAKPSNNGMVATH